MNAQFGTSSLVGSVMFSTMINVDSVSFGNETLSNEPFTFVLDHEGRVYFSIKVSMSSPDVLFTPAQVLGVPILDIISKGAAAKKFRSHAATMQGNDVISFYVYIDSYAEGDSVEITLNRILSQSREVKWKSSGD